MSVLAKWLHVVAPSNDGYVFANYITGCDSPTPSADNELQNNEASVEPVIPVDEVYAPTTASSSGGSCNSPDELDIPWSSVRRQSFWRQSFQHKNFQHENFRWQGTPLIISVDINSQLKST